MERELLKDGKLGKRIAIIGTKNGLKIVSTGINSNEGKELTFGYWKQSTVKKKISEFAKLYNIEKYNHLKD